MCQARGDQEERELILKRLLLPSGTEEHCAAGKNGPLGPLQPLCAGILANVHLRGGTADPRLSCCSSADAGPCKGS